MAPRYRAQDIAHKGEAEEPIYNALRDDDRRVKGIYERVQNGFTSIAT